MKKITALILVSISSIYAAWVTPLEKDCHFNSKYDENNSLCYASWQDAAFMCQSLDARVPTIEELSEVITKCKGVVDKSSENKTNEEYQACYQANGFSNAYYYWSATPDEDRENYAVDVYFGNGTTYFSKKVNRLAVRCIKDEK